MKKLYMTLAAGLLAVPAMTAQTVTLAFTGEDLPQEAYKCVTLLDIVHLDDEGDPTTFTVDSNNYELELTAPGFMVVYQPNEDYAVIDYLITDAEGAEVSYDAYTELPGLIQQNTLDEFGEDEEAGFIYTVGIYPIPEVEGYTFTAVIAYIGETEPEPVKEPVTVTINYVGDLEGPTYTYVHTLFEPLSGSFETSTTVDNDSFNFVCIPAVSISFEAFDDYEIDSVTTIPADNEYINVQGGKYVKSVSLKEGLTGSVSINVVMIPDATGINALGTDKAEAVIYNLQGVRVDGNHLPKGVYIINGKKVAVK